MCHPSSGVLVSGSVHRHVACDGMSLCFILASPLVNAF